MLSLLLGLVPTILGLMTDCQKGRISLAELEAQLQVALYQAYTSIYAEGQKTFRVALQSEDSFVRRAWPVAFYSFLSVQMWFVFIQPLGHAFGQHFGFWFPILRTGDVLLEWNFLFLGSMLGVGLFLPGKEGGRSFVSRTREAVRNWRGASGQ